MAKRTNSFSCKGELNLGEGLVYEVKKKGKEEIIEIVRFLDILNEFDGKAVTINIKEENELIGEELEEEELEEE